MAKKFLSHYVIVEVSDRHVYRRVVGLFGGFARCLLVFLFTNLKKELQASRIQALVDQGEKPRTTSKTLKKNR